MKQRAVALEWSKRVAAVAHGHYRAASRYSRLHFWLGMPTVLLATIVGTSVFAMLQQRPEVWWQITIGLMSILAAVLSALQSFLNYSDKTSGIELPEPGITLLDVSLNSSWLKMMIGLYWIAFVKK